MMESLVTDSLRRSAVHKAVNSCGRTHQSAHALLWEEVARVIKVIALKQEALFGKERTWFFFISHLEAGGLFRGRNGCYQCPEKQGAWGSLSYGC